MQEKQVKVTHYVCENCGAEHSKKSAFTRDAITGKEICEKCRVAVELAPVEIYAKERPGDFDTEKVYIDKSCNDFQWDEERYWKVITAIRRQYIALWQEVNRYYVKSNLTEFIQNNPDIEELMYNGEEDDV